MGQTMRFEAPTQTVMLDKNALGNNAFLQPRGLLRSVGDIQLPDKEISSMTDFELGRSHQGMCFMTSWSLANICNSSNRIGSRNQRHSLSSVLAKRHLLHH